MSIATLVGRRWVVTVPPNSLPGGLGQVDQDPDAVREQACRIVSSNDSVCTPATTTPPKTGGGSIDLSWLGVILWVLLIVGLLLVVGVIVRRLAAGGWTRRRRLPDDDQESDEVEVESVAVDRSREPENWRADADAHRLHGRFREALRCRYRALVGDLARRGLIDEIPGRTTGEEREQLRTVRPRASVPFGAAADLFDEAWYGNAHVGLGDDDRFQALERDVLSAAHGDRR